MVKKHEAYEDLIQHTNGKHSL